MALSPRVLVVHLPAFRLERCGWSADDLACLTAEWKSATRLAALTPLARQLGLRHGMSTSEARAREPDVVLEPLDDTGERIDRLALAEALRHWSDRVSLLWQDDYALDITHTAHLFGGEQGLVQQVRERLQGFGHEVRTAVAGDLLSAAALARHDAPDGHSGPSSLAELPISSLRPSEDLATALATIGIDTIGQLARLDPASVSGRFGAEGVHLHRVSRGEVLGEWLDSCQEASPVRCQVQLGGGVTRLEPLMFAMRGALATLCEQLFRRDRVIVRLAIRLSLESGQVRLLRIRVGRPTRDVPTILRVLSARLQGIQLDAPASDLALEVEESAPDGGLQPSLHDRTQAAESEVDLIARLADALGAEAIVRPVLVESWRPESAWRDGHDVQAPVGRPSTMKLDPVQHQWRHQLALAPPRPTIVLPRPQLIDVREADGTPLRVHVVNGWQQVQRARGPERLHGEWWSDDRGFERDYWSVQLQTGTAWVFSEGGRWFLQGWWD